jgi:phosphatidylglycerophosphate synthase
MNAGRVYPSASPGTSARGLSAPGRRCIQRQRRQSGEGTRGAVERAIDRTFGRWHAPLMLVATGASLALRAAWPAALSCTASLGLLLRIGRGHYTPKGRFGSANTVTLLRLAMTVALALFGARAPRPWAALLVLVVLLLDGVDGALARRRGLASAFGALLDQECDALLVLVSALILYVEGSLGAFVLVPGVLRYLYVLLIELLPSGGRQQPRTRVGRYGFAVLVVSLVASLWPVPGHAWFARMAALLIVYSFGRSIYWSWTAERNPPAA